MGSEMLPPNCDGRHRNFLDQCVFLDPWVAGYLSNTRKSCTVFSLAKGRGNKDTASHAYTGLPFDVGPRQ